MAGTTAFLPLVLATALALLVTGTTTPATTTAVPNATLITETNTNSMADINTSLMVDNKTNSMADFNINSMADTASLTTDSNDASLTTDSNATSFAETPTSSFDNSTCTTDHRLSVFPIRLIKCNIADLTCFREGKYVYGGGADGVASGNEPRCTGLWSQGPCDKFEWLVVDKARFYATGYIRTTCVPANVCPKGYIMMNFDGNCYSSKEVAVNCPKVRGFKLTYNVFGEGECVCAKRKEMPVRYCDTVAVGGVRPTTPQVKVDPVPGMRMY